MSQGARGQRRTIRDYGSRRIMDVNGNGTRGISLPAQLEDTEFPTEHGEELRVTYDPEAGEVTLRKKEK